MKMNKIDLEFVSFAANDVITTSGLATAYFQLNGNLVSDLLSTASYQNNGMWKIGRDYFNLHLYADSDGLTDDLRIDGDGKYFVLTEGRSSFNGNIAAKDSLSLYNVTMVDSKPQSGEEKTLLSAILGWLGDYGA